MPRKKTTDELEDAKPLKERIMMCAASGVDEATTIALLEITKAEFEHYRTVYEAFKGKQVEFAKYAITQSAASGDTRAALHILKAHDTEDDEDDTGYQNFIRGLCEKVTALIEGAKRDTKPSVESKPQTIQSIAEGVDA